MDKGLKADTKKTTGGNAATTRRRNMEIVQALGSRCIVMVGMMGCGKSAIGRIVAAALELPFHDSDKEIEEAAGMTVPEIFTSYGEAEFRRGEERVIKRLLERGPLVLALGGGAFLSEKTRMEIGQRGLSLWLQADVDLLLSRVMRRPGKRPLLQTPDPRQTLINLVEQRSPVYALADLHVKSSRSSKAKTRENALKALHKSLLEAHDTGTRG